MRTLCTLAALVIGSAAACAHAGPGDGTLYILNKSDADVSAIDTSTGKVIATMEVGEGPHEAVVSPDGETLIVCNYGIKTPGRTLSVIDTKTNTTKGYLDLKEYHRPHGIVFLPGSDTIAVTAEVEQKLLLINYRTLEIVAAIDTDQRASHMVAVSPDGATGYVANILPGTMSVLDLEKHELIKVVPTGAGAEGVAVHPSKPEVWVTNRSQGSVAVVNTETLEVETKIVCAAFPIRIAFTPDGAHALVSCAQSGDVAVINTESRTVKRRISMDEEPVGDTEKGKRLFSDQFGESPVPVGILIRPDGKLAYVANTNADVVSVIDLQTWTIIERLRAGKEPDGLAWLPNE